MFLGRCTRVEEGEGKWGVERPEIKGVDWIELDGVQQSSLERRRGRRWNG